MYCILKKYKLDNYLYRSRNEAISMANLDADDPVDASDSDEECFPVFYFILSIPIPI